MAPYERFYDYPAALRGTRTVVPYHTILLEVSVGCTAKASMKLQISFAGKKCRKKSCLLRTAHYVLQH